MHFTWGQRIYKQIRRFITDDLLEEDHVQMVKRALYFSQYKVAIHFAPSVSNWVDFHELLADVNALLASTDHRIVSSSQALYFNVYTNDPDVIARLRFHAHKFHFASIHCIDASCWHIRHSKPKNKGKFYHKFPYRVRASSPSVLTPEVYKGLLTGEWFVWKQFFYCNEVRDVILFKLVHEDDIVEISERDRQA